MTIKFSNARNGKKEIIKLLDVGVIFPIIDSQWVSSVQCVPKKCCITVVLY